MNEKWGGGGKRVFRGEETKMRKIKMEEKNIGSANECVVMLWSKSWEVVSKTGRALLK